MSTRFATFGAGVVLAGAVLVGGCSSTTGVERAGTVSRGAGDVKGDLKSVGGKVNRLLASLKGLQDVAEKGLDLKAQFAQYKIELADLEAVAGSLKARGEDMRANREEYIKAWETEMAAVKDESIQSASKARRDAVAAAFKDVDGAAKDARANFDLFAKDANAIRVALENDLTPAGVKSVTPVIQKTDGEGKAVNKSVDAVVTSLENLAKQLPTLK
jgi:uncharacterized protein YcnI